VAVSEPDGADVNVKSFLEECAAIVNSDIQAQMDKDLSSSIDMPSSAHLPRGSAVEETKVSESMPSSGAGSSATLKA